MDVEGYPADRVARLMDLPEPAVLRTAILARMRLRSELSQCAKTASRPRSRPAFQGSQLPRNYKLFDGPPCAPLVARADSSPSVVFVHLPRPSQRQRIRRHISVTTDPAAT